jgi:hypothetical protein
MRQMKSMVGAGAFLVLAGCAAFERPDPSNVQAYCTVRNGEQLGVEGRAYYGGCPKASEGELLAGLERGRGLAWTPALWSYQEQMRQTERELIASSSDSERSQLRTRLRDLESWSIHILNSPGTYSTDR